MNGGAPEPGHPMFMRLSCWVLSATLVLAGCQAESEERFQGYAEAESIMVAAQQSGQLTSLSVRRGDTIQAGAPLFSQDEATEAAGVIQAQAQLAQAQAQLSNLETGKRPSELAAIAAQLKDAQARRTLSAEQLDRQRALVTKGFVSAESLDQARTQLARDDAAIAQIKAELSTARLPGRQAERASAQAQIDANRAVLAQNTIRLNQKAQLSPVAGQVQDVFYRTGEWAAPGQPVVAILPPENIKVRFFVPEGRLSAVKTGQTVAIECDGCPDTVPATIRFISATAEYTPPVLYSEKNRHRLVYLVEAWPKPGDAAKLHPGQPVGVSLQSPGQ